MIVIIPLCGKGERFRSKGYTDPKPLVKVFEKEILAYTIDSLNVSAEQIYIIVNDNTYDAVRTLCSKYPAINIINIHQETRGAAETVRIGILAMGRDDDTDILIVDGDTFYTEDIVSKIEIVKEEYGALTDTDGFNTFGAVIYFRDEGIIPQYSYINMDTETNTIREIAEKKKISNYANTGAYYFKSAVDFCLYSGQIIKDNYRLAGEFYISAVIDKMIGEGVTFKGIAGNHISLGTPELVEEYKKRTEIHLFDMDGTLVNTDDIYMKVWKVLLEPYGIDVNEDFYNSHIHGNNDKDVFNRLFDFKKEGIDFDTISKRKDELFVKYIDQVKEISGAISFINMLHHRGHKVAIVTNANRVAAEAILKYMNICCDYLCIGSECSAAKPSPEPYLNAVRYFLGSLAVLVDSTATPIYVYEDSKSGLLSATGMCAVGVNPRCITGISSSKHNNVPILEQYGANIIVDNFSENLYNKIKEYTPSDNNIGVTKRSISDLIYKSFSLNHCRRDIKNVTIESNYLKGGYINDVFKCNLHTYKGNIIKVVCKMENKKENSLSDMANKLELYDREYFFYEVIAPYVNISVPSCYAIVRDENFEKIGIIMEDYSDKGYILNPDFNTLPISSILGVINYMTAFHQKFSNKDLCKKFAGLYKNNTTPFRDFVTEFMKTNIDRFINRWKYMMRDGEAEKLRQVVAEYEHLHDSLSIGTLTLCHGDFKAPNMFFDTDINEPTMIDWQYIVEGKGTQDLIFFLIESLTVERFNNLYDLCTTYYYEKIVEHGLVGYKREEFAADLRDSLYYFPLFVAVWFGTTDPDYLLDKNFPFFFIKRFLNAMRKVSSISAV